MPPAPTPILERLERLSTPEPNTGCWLFFGSGCEGYGQIWCNTRKKLVLAHRASYEIMCGEISPELDLDHLCRVRCCINPAHLEPVTRQTNLQRGRNANSEKTHCPKGHLYDETNTYMRKDKRVCRECGRQAMRTRSKKQRNLGSVQQTIIIGSIPIPSTKTG